MRRASSVKCQATRPFFMLQLSAILGPLIDGSMT